MIPELYAKPMCDMADAVHRIKECYRKALDNTGIDEENRRQKVDTIEDGEKVVVRIITTFKIQKREG